MLSTLTNLDPHILFLGGRFINLDNVKDYTVNYLKLYIIFDYGHMLKDVILFGSPEELALSVAKIESIK